MLYVTEKGLEEEIHSIDAWGRGEAEVVQKAREGVWHYQPEYSPDGKRIAYATTATASSSWTPTAAA